MAAREKSVGRQKPQTSLLWSPPASGFTQIESANAVLMPALAPAEELHVEDAEADNFIGQVPAGSLSSQPFQYFNEAQRASSFNDPFSSIKQGPIISSNTGVNALGPTPNPSFVPSMSISSSHTVDSSGVQSVPLLPPSSSQFVSHPTSTPSPVASYTDVTPPQSNYNIQNTGYPPTSGFTSYPPAHGNVGPPPQYSPTQVPPYSHPSMNPIGGSYVPVRPHWFFLRTIEGRQLWMPMSRSDSLNLEEALRDTKPDNPIVPTDGGRYDVDVRQRARSSVYWEEPLTQVRRCTWFYRLEGEKRFVPYPEDFAEKIEEEYQKVCVNNLWHQKFEFPGGETFVVHSPTVIVHFQPSYTPDEWGNVPENCTRPRTVKRGVDEFDNIEDGEAIQVDHLVFVIHGVGNICDIRFRSLNEVVGDMRSISDMLMETHYKTHLEERRVGRVEFLPVSWHKELHGETTGIDRKLKQITLTSVPKLRYLANDTILDVLFYCSPVYCQTIIDQVGTEMNRLYTLFLQRNPGYSGHVSVAGHSLGSVILFDLLLHQHDPDQPQQSAGRKMSAVSEHGMGDPGFALTEEETIVSCLNSLELDEFVDVFKKERIDMKELLLLTEEDLKQLGLPLGSCKKIINYITDKKHKQELSTARDSPSQFLHTGLSAREEAKAKKMSITSSVNYIFGDAGTGQPFVKYPRLVFSPSNFFALGAPISIFLTVRGIDQLQEDFRFPTCPAFFNIFHPYDPVAYRIEPLIDSSVTVPPQLIPHHKGRKRMHLEIKESLARVGSDLKQRLFDSIWSTWISVNEFARAHTAPPRQSDVDSMVDEELRRREQEHLDETESLGQSETGLDDELIIGKLNGGRRIDYVLQEKPIESFNDYLFSLQSHACYWESEDTVLLMIKEIYIGMGIYPVPQGMAPPANKPTLYRVSQLPGSYIPPPSGGSLPPYPPAQSATKNPYSRNYKPQNFPPPNPLSQTSPQVFMPQNPSTAQGFILQQLPPTSHGFVPQNLPSSQIFTPENPPPQGIIPQNLPLSQEYIPQNSLPSQEFASQISTSQGIIPQTAVPSHGFKPDNSPSQGLKPENSPSQGLIPPNNHAQFLPSSESSTSTQGFIAAGFSTQSQPTPPQGLFMPFTQPTSAAQENLVQIPSQNTPPPVLPGPPIPSSQSVSTLQLGKDSQREITPPLLQSTAISRGFTPTPPPQPVAASRGFTPTPPPHLISASQAYNTPLQSGYNPSPQSTPGGTQSYFVPLSSSASELPPQIYQNEPTANNGSFSGPGFLSNRPPASHTPSPVPMFQEGNLSPASFFTGPVAPPQTSFSPAQFSSPPQHPVKSSPYPNAVLPSNPQKLGMDPTAPPSETANVAPPPRAGFVRNSVLRK